MSTECTVVTTDADLAVCHQIRRQVFVDEQGVAADLEFDGLDPACVHFLVRRQGRPVATARLRIVDGKAKAQRVAVLASERRRGTGRVVMHALEQEASRRGLDQVVLHAQVAAVPFYERIGYRVVGEVFMEADIEHVVMTRELSDSRPAYGQRDA